MTRKELITYVLQLSGTTVRGRPMPQTQIAQALGVSVEAVRKILRGQRDKDEATPEEEELVDAWASGAHEDALAAYMKLHPDGRPYSKLAVLFGPHSTLEKTLKDLEKAGRANYNRATRVWVVP